MAKLSDKDRMLNKIPADGSSIGNYSLRDLLNLDDSRYWKIRQALIEEGKIGTGRGKGGSVFRIGEEKGKDHQQKSKKDFEYKDEQALYEDFLATIENDYTKSLDIKQFIAQKTAHAGKKNTGGIWTRPDITLIGVQSYAYYPGKSMDIITFELKHIKDLDITAVFEAAAHSRISNLTYLSVYLPGEIKDFLTDEDSDRMIAECKRFNVGLLFFENPKKYDTFTFRLDPERGLPDPAEQNKFISAQINEKKRQMLLTFFH